MEFSTTNFVLLADRRPGEFRTLREVPRPGERQILPTLFRDGPLRCGSGKGGIFLNFFF